MTKRYDQAYFDRWYRDPKRRVNTPAVVRRKVRLALGVAEALLERPVRSILDVGCGEAPWRSHLLDERPNAEYVGIDSSDYVVRRYGRSRGIRHGTFGTLDALHIDRAFDVIICADMMQYVPADELARGVRAIASLLDGVAYLEAFTNVDELEGDKRHWHPRTPAYYRRVFREAGLTSVGMHCYVSDRLLGATLALERAE